jgi:hypothetical protein
VGTITALSMIMLFWPLISKAISLVRRKVADPVAAV